LATLVEREREREREREEKKVEKFVFGGRVWDDGMWWGGALARWLHHFLKGVLKNSLEFRRSLFELSNKAIAF
jgi:hypothetical protein